MSSKHKVYRMVLAALLLALALVLPFLTGQIPKIGAMLCPMHFPVLLCGYFCGPWYALFVGAVAPILRFLLFGMPPIMPSGVGMCFELATYGLVSGALYKYLPRRKIFIYVSLISAMFAGRAVWGIIRVILFGLGKSSFGWAAFMTGAFTNAIPGIVVQIVLVPMLVMLLDKYTQSKS